MKTLNERKMSPLKRMFALGMAACAALPALAQEMTVEGGEGQVLEEIVVTAETQVRLADRAVRTEVISAREVEIVQAQKLADVLEYQTGIRVESNCSNCNASEIRMLGLQQRYLSLLSDGSATFSGLAGVYGIEQIPTAMVERIEITKGGGSVLYGANAIAGVVNLVPKDPQENRVTVEMKPGWMEGARSGDGWNMDTSLMTEWVNSGGTFGLLAYGLQSFVPGVDVDGDGFTEVSRRDLYAGGVRMVFQPWDEMKISLDYMHADEERRGGQGRSALDLPAHETFISEELHSRRNVGSLTLKHEVTDTFDYQASISVATTERSSYYGGISALGYAVPGSRYHDPSVVRRLARLFPRYRRALQDPDGIFYNPEWSPSLGYGETDDLMLSLDLSANWRPLDGHAFTFGYQYRYETLSDDSGLGRKLEVDYENHGLLLQHDWQVADTLEFQYGVRADIHSETDSVHLSPRVSVKYAPVSDFEVRASLSTGFRAPELFDEDLHVANVGGTLEVVGLSPKLKEESSISYSLSPRWKLNEHWEVEGSVFYTQIKDIYFNDISTDNPATQGIMESTKINAGNAEVYGGELNIIHQSGPFTTELGYVEQRSRYARPQLVLGTPGDALDNAIYVSRFERTPERYGVLKLAYEQGPWTLFMAGKITGSMDVPHVVNDGQSGELLGNKLEKSGSFFTIDVGLAYAWELKHARKVTLSAGVKNVLNEFQDDLDRGAFRDPAYTYGPRFPRTVYLGLKMEF